MKAVDARVLIVRLIHNGRTNIGIFPRLVVDWLSRAVAEYAEYACCVCVCFNSLLSPIYTLHRGHSIRYIILWNSSRHLIEGFCSSVFGCIRLYSALYGFNQPTSNIDVAVMDSSFYTAYQNLLLFLLLLYYYGDGLMAMVFITIAAAVVVIGCSVLFSWSLYKQYALWLSTLSVW